MPCHRKYQNVGRNFFTAPVMIQNSNKYLLAAAVVITLVQCRKPETSCPKMGYEYINSTCHCWYSPVDDSVPVGTAIFLEASVPKVFIDENSNVTVQNTSAIVNGPLGVGMISPIYQAAVDSFEITAQVGKVIKDTANFTVGQLKGFRTIEWDGTPTDSFKLKIKIRPLAKGIFSFTLKQQSSEDKDCALYKYFLSPGNANQHLNYWMDAFGNASDLVTFFTYCVKVY